MQKDMSISISQKNAALILRRSCWAHVEKYICIEKWKNYLARFCSEKKSDQGVHFRTIFSRAAILFPNSNIFYILDGELYLRLSEKRGRPFKSLHNKIGGILIFVIIP